jgi:hypothetical protein
MEPEMAEQSTNGQDRLDYATSTSICRAIGEKLVGTGFSDATDLPPQFQSLLAAMQRQENQERPESEPPLPFGSPTVTG